MPTTVTYKQLADAIASTLGVAASLARTESYNELGEAIVDEPTLQVYPQSGTQDAGGGGTDRFTFGAAVRQTEVIMYCDLYAQARSHIGEDMAVLLTGIDEIQEILEGQDKEPFFGLQGIKAFSWRWDRVTFNYSGIDYVAARYILTLRVF